MLNFIQVAGAEIQRAITEQVGLQCTALQFIESADVILNIKEANIMCILTTKHLGVMVVKNKDGIFTASRMY